MNPRDFCYWLRGFFEINEAHEGMNILGDGLTPDQTQMIMDHLDKVFQQAEPILNHVKPYNPVDGFINPAKFDSPLEFIPSWEGSC
jgi:hypothetical protein